MPRKKAKPSETSGTALGDALLDELVLLLARMTARECLASEQSKPTALIAKSEAAAARTDAVTSNFSHTKKPRPRARAPPRR